MSGYRTAEEVVAEWCPRYDALVMLAHDVRQVFEREPRSTLDTHALPDGKVLVMPGTGVDRGVALSVAAAASMRLVDTGSGGNGLFNVHGEEFVLAMLVMGPKDPNRCFTFCKTLREHDDGGGRLQAPIWRVYAGALLKWMKKTLDVPSDVEWWASKYSPGHPSANVK